MIRLAPSPLQHEMLELIQTARHERMAKEAGLQAFASGLEDIARQELGITIPNQQ
jgi:hypothetical protein